MYPSMAIIPVVILAERPEGIFVGINNYQIFKIWMSKIQILEISWWKFFIKTQKFFLCFFLHI